MVPVSVPLNEPLPVALLKVIVVVLVGLDGLPSASCDCTVTLKGWPVVPVAGTVVYARLLAAPTLTIRLELATPVSPEIEAVIVVVCASVRVVATPVAWPAVKVTVVV